MDDEYWETEDPEKAFHQPSGKPSTIAAFNSYIKLTQIAAYALRNLVRLSAFRGAVPDAHSIAVVCAR